MRVAGIGFRGAATVTSLRDAYERAGGDADALATVAEKAGAEAVTQFAQEVGLTVVAVATGALAAQPVLSRSERVAGRFGTGSLAEAAALAAVGPGARLLGPRVVSEDGMATAAIAERTEL
jgi:cobalt-precorrin 5A hydrolase